MDVVGKFVQIREGIEQYLNVRIMNELHTSGKAGDLINRIRDLIEIINRQTKAESQKVIEGTVLGNLDLSADEVLVIRTIRALRGKVPLKRVVEKLAEVKDEPVHSSTVSAIMTRLETNGLLSREANEVDKRQPLNGLTPQGEELARRLDEVTQMVLKNVIDSLQLDDALVDDLNQRVDRACERIKEQLQSKPSVAGVYDYALGGIFNTASDRKWVEDGVKINPRLREAAKANRAFLQRAVHFLAKEKNISQFIDIGSGFPTNRNTHEVALDLNPLALITYLDNDSEVVRASRSLLHDVENVRVTQQDVKFIKRWLPPDRFQNIDLSKPVGILLVAVLHFVTDDSEVRDILNFLKGRLARGSYLVVSHSTSDGRNMQVMQSLVANYQRQVNDVRLRTQAEISSFLQGFELIEPGLVPISKWKPELPDSLAGKQVDPEDSRLLACVAKL